jgi:hypothetical protein
MKKLTDAELDRAVAKAMGFKYVTNCKAWGTTK